MDTGKSALGLDGNLAAALGYPIGIIAIICLIMEKENRFVKFHAVQSLFLVGLQIAAGIVIGILGAILGLVLNMIHMELVAWILVLGFRFVIFAIFIILWIIGGIKAYGGQWYKLPIIGELAWKTINK